MRILYALMLGAALVGCARRVEVTSSPPPAAAEAGLQVNNTLTEPVNVYVVTSDTEMFVKQVAANSSERMPVRGVPPGTSVSLRATTVDGTRTFRRANVMLGSTYIFNVP